MDLIPYQKYYKETELWKKLSRVGKKVGIKAVYAVLLLFYASVSKQTSLRDKVIIYVSIPSTPYFIKSSLFRTLQSKTTIKFEECLA